MQINLTKTRVYSDLSAYYQKLSIHEKYSLRLFPSENLAVSELVHGHLRLFPHKKKLIIVGTGSPLLPALTTFLSGEGVEVILKHWADLKEAEDSISEKDLLMIVYVEDHLFTGEIFPFEEWVPKWNSKKIYTLGISHKSFLLRSNLQTEADGFRMRVFTIGSHLSLAVLGTRNRKLPSLVLGDTLIHELSVNEEESFFSTKAGDSPDVHTIEKDLEPIFEPYFEKEEARTNDRLVGRIPGVDSFAIKEYLAELWEKPVNENWSISSSLCEWGGLRSNHWLEWKENRKHWPVDELFVIDLSLAQEFKAVLPKLSQEIRSLMGQDAPK